MSMYTPTPANPPRQMHAKKRLSALEKSAVVVAHLHPTQAAAVLRGLRADDLRRFSSALQQVRMLSEAAVGGVIREFLAALNAAPMIDEGADTARALLGAVLDAPVVDRLLSEVGISKLNLWVSIGSMSPAETGRLLAEEHPQTIAWVLGRISPEHARATLTTLPKNLAQQSVLAMGTGKVLARDTTKVIEEALTRRLLELR